eukprot:596364-Amphidinium_carterae.1
MYGAPNQVRQLLKPSLLFPLPAFKIIRKAVAREITRKAVSRDPETLAWSDPTICTVLVYSCGST